MGLKWTMALLSCSLLFGSVFGEVTDCKEGANACPGGHVASSSTPQGTLVLCCPKGYDIHNAVKTINHNGTTVTTRNCTCTERGGDSTPGLDGNMKIPPFNTDFKTPKLEIPPLNTDFKMPQIDTPDFNTDFKMPKIDTPDFNTDFKMPKIEIPPFNTDFKMPKLEIPPFNTDFKMPKIEIPPFNTDFKMPKLEIPPFNTDFKMPKIEIPHFNTDFKLPGNIFSPADEQRLKALEQKMSRSD
ncbi:hypothetical protein ACOMHN_007487 [Nucella lapillus]